MRIVSTEKSWNAMSSSPYTIHMQHWCTQIPLFMGFSCSQNVNKEIIIRTLETLVNTGLQGFLFTQFQAVGTYLTLTLFVDNIELLFEKYECVQISTMGFPENWKELLQC